MTTYEIAKIFNMTNSYFTIKTEAGKVVTKAGTKSRMRFWSADDAAKYITETLGGEVAGEIKWSGTVPFVDHNDEEAPVATPDAEAPEQTTEVVTFTKGMLATTKAASNKVSRKQATFIDEALEAAREFGAAAITMDLDDMGESLRMRCWGIGYRPRVDTVASPEDAQAPEDDDSTNMCAECGTHTDDCGDLTHGLCWSCGRIDCALAGQQAALARVRDEFARGMIPASRYRKLRALMLAELIDIRLGMPGWYVCDPSETPEDGYGSVVVTAGGVKHKIGVGLFYVMENGDHRVVTAIKDGQVELCPGQLDKMTYSLPIYAIGVKLAAGIIQPVRHRYMVVASHPDRPITYRAGSDNSRVKATFMAAHEINGGATEAWVIDRNFSERVVTLLPSNSTQTPV